VSLAFRRLLGVGGIPALAKMAGYWDADHVSVGGGNTTVLLDQSGRGNNLPAIVAAPAPVVVGGKNVIQGTGTEHYDLDPLSLIPSHDAICMISVAKPAGTGGDRFISEFSGGGKTFALSAEASSSGKWGIFAGAGAWFIANQAADAAARHIYIAQIEGTLIRGWRDGAPKTLLSLVAPTMVNGSRASVFANSHIFSGDWRLTIIAQALTKAELEALIAVIAVNEGITSLLPAASFNADDDFSVGAAIDTAGTRRAGATAWTAFNLGAVTNAQAGGTLSLTLPQESNFTARGYSQPVTNGVVQVYRCKIVPANIGATDKHHAGMYLIQTTGNRAFSVEVGYDSANGNRQIRVKAWGDTNLTTWFSFGDVPVGGFSAADWNQEWTIWAMWDDNNVTFWYQVGSGALQFLYNGDWSSWMAGSGGTTYPQVIMLGVSSQNAAGGNTVADFTDFAREY